MEARDKLCGIGSVLSSLPGFQEWDGIQVGRLAPQVP